MEYTSLVNRGIAMLMPYRMGKPLELVQKELGVKNLIRLNAGESSYGVSRRVREVFDNYSKKTAIYPDPNCYYLKYALFQRFGYVVNNIVVGADTPDLLSLVLRAFVNESHKVIVPRLSSIHHERAVVLSGATIVPSAVDENWAPDLLDILNRIDDRTRLVLISNPTDPIGGYILGSDLENFLHEVPEDVLVVVDEAYIEFVGAGARELYELIEKYNNLIVLRSFSHVYGLASLRIGYMLCCEEISGILNTLRDPHNVSQIAQDCALAAVSDQGFIRKVLSFYDSERGRFQSFCDFYRLGMLPTKTNSVTINFGSRADYYYHCLMRVGIFTRHLASYDLPSMINITLGNAYQTDFLIARLEKFVVDDRLKMLENMAEEEERIKQKQTNTLGE